MRLNAIVMTLLRVVPIAAFAPVFQPPAGAVCHVAERSGFIVARTSWVPPARGSIGRPIEAPVISADHAQIERAAAARNAGIDGYHMDQSSVQETAANADNAEGEFVDIWTFGTAAADDAKKVDDPADALMEKLAGMLPLQ